MTNLDLILNQYDELISQAEDDFLTSNSPYRGNYLSLIYRSVLQSVMDDNIKINHLDEFKNKFKKRNGRKYLIKLLFTRGVEDKIFSSLNINIENYTNEAFLLWKRLCEMVHLKYEQSDESYMEELMSKYNILYDYILDAERKIMSYLENPENLWNTLNNIVANHDISGKDKLEDFQLEEVRMKDFSKGILRISVNGTITRDVHNVGIECFPCEFDLINKGPLLILDEESYNEDQKSFFGE